MTSQILSGNHFVQANRWIMLRPIASLLCLIALSGIPLWSHAAQSQAAEKPADVRVLIDVSGSMKQNDPRNLRRPALELLINLLPEGSRAGVWTFGRWVNMLVPHKNVSDQWRDQAQSQSRMINSVALHTNIGLALEKANYDADPGLFPTSLDYERSVILLTDGVVDIDRDPTVNQSETQRIENDVISAYRRAGVVIHTIALSTNADAELLENLARETSGSFAVAEDASDLNRIFLNALDRAVPADRVPLENNRFQIDSSIEEFTALVFRKPDAVPTALYSPAGDRYDASSEGASIRWLSNEAYDLITIKQPVEGEWQIDTAVDPDNRVSVVSNLALNVSPIQNPHYAGDELDLEIQLSQDGELIIDEGFLEIIDASAAVKDSEPRDQKVDRWQSSLNRSAENPGIYNELIQSQWPAGEYQLQVLLDGKTFKREKTLRFTTSPAYAVAAFYDDDASQAKVVVKALNPEWQASNIALSGVARSEGLADIPLNFSQPENRQWIAWFTPAKSGDYQIEVEALNGAFYAGTELAGVSIELPATIGEPEITPLPATDNASVESLLEDMEPEPEAVPEPTPEASVAKEEIAEETGEPPAAEEEGGINYLLLIGGLVFGNVLMIGGLYLLYRKITAPPQENDSDDTAVEEPSAKEEPLAEEEPSAKEKPLAEEEPSAQEEPSAKEEPSAEKAPAVEEEAEGSEKPGDAEAETEAETAEQEQLDEPGQDEAATDEPEPVIQPESGEDAEVVLELGQDEPGEGDADADSQSDDSVPEQSSADGETEEDLESELEQLIDELGEDFGAQLDSEEDGDPATDTAEDDEEITLDFDGEFDLSTDISEDVKKQG